MTAIIAIAVNPEIVELPYFLIASDSKRVLKQEDEQGILQTVAEDEDFKKIHKVKDRLVAFAGKIEDRFIDELLIKLNGVDLDFDDFSRLAFDLVEDYIENYSPFDIARCNVIIGENRNYQPKTAQFLITKDNNENSRLNVESPEKGNAIPVAIGNIQGMDDLYDRFLNRVRNAVNLNSLVVKKAAREYLKGVAKRMPEYCNENIKIEII